MQYNFWNTGSVDVYTKGVLLFPTRVPQWWSQALQFQKQAFHVLVYSTKTHCQGVDNHASNKASAGKAERPMYKKNLVYIPPQIKYSKLCHSMYMTSC